MKKAMIVICMLVLVLSSFSVGFAAETDKVVTEEETMRYVGTYMHMETLQISSSGKATMKARLEPKTEDSIDKVIVTIKLENPKGVILHNETYDATWSSVAFQYQVLVNESVATRGKYTMYATYKCYKNGSLIEKLSGSTTDTY